MPKAHSKRRKECNQYEMLRRFVPELPPLSRDQEKAHSDFPDFRIKIGNSSVGIEVTNVLKRPLAEGELDYVNVDNEQQYIVKNAQRLGNERNCPPLLVCVLFANDFAPKKRDRDSYSQALAQYVCEHLPKESGGEDRSQPRTETLKEKVVSVTIYGSPAMNTPLWQCGGAGRVDEECAEVIQDAIDGKEPKLAPNRAKCDQFWLLLVADVSLGRAAMIEPSPATRNHRFKTSFDRVYFLDFAHGEVSPLLVEPPSS